MADDQTNNIAKAVKIANQAQELRLMKWVIIAIIGSLGALSIAAVSIYRLDAIAQEVQAMPSPAEHEGVHALQDKDRQYIMEKVDVIQVQQTIDSEKIDNTEKTLWKIAQKLGVVPE